MKSVQYACGGGRAGSDGGEQPSALLQMQKTANTVPYTEFSILNHVPYFPPNITVEKVQVRGLGCQ